MQKNAVNGRYEQMRAGYGILRNMGKLVEAAVRFSGGLRRLPLRGPIDPIKAYLNGIVNPWGRTKSLVNEEPVMIIIGIVSVL